jgi:hypothetical protein
MLRAESFRMTHVALTGVDDVSTLVFLRLSLNVVHAVKHSH